MRKIDFEAELNTEQWAAVTHGQGPQLVVAGAGSGKTRAITYRIAWLAARGVDPGRIVAVTFTNKAAGEMRERASRLLELDPLPAFVGTFHRYALVLLRRWGERIGIQSDFSIVDADDQLRILRRALDDEGLSETSFAPRAVRAAISAAKNRLLDATAYEARAQGFFARSIAPVFRRYERALRQHGGLDFDDMLAAAVRLLAGDEDLRERVRRRTEYLLVDEFQDTNHAQLRLVLELAGPAGNLTAVGDEDQGIYRWRGAELDNILRFEKTFPGATVRKLERNYRSTANILSAADAVVGHNTQRREKHLWTEAEAGEPVVLYRARDELDEARWIVAAIAAGQDRFPLADCAILVRTNAQTRALEEELLACRLPYTLVGVTRFYQRAEIQDLVAYLRLARNPFDGLALDRVLNRPARGIGDTTRAHLTARARDQGRPLWDLIALDDLGPLPARSAQAVRRFGELVRGLHEQREAPLSELVDLVLNRTKYRDLFDAEDPEGRSRLENIEEFQSAVQEFCERPLVPGEAGDSGAGLDALTAFLDHISLNGELDDWQRERGLSVMTLHAAKGLEFASVTVAGLESGLLPHFNAGESSEAHEEERRLFYVGMTRARRRLALTACRRRRVAGRYVDREESPFLREVPAELLIVEQSPELFASPRTAGVEEFFGRRGGSGFGGGAARPAASAERRYEPEPEDGLRRGTRVRHPTLGVGTLIAADGDGPDARLTVVFDRLGKRKLVARYAQLEPA